MKMCFMRGFLLLPALSNALLLRLELMVSWIFHEDHFVKPVKVYKYGCLSFLSCQQCNIYSNATLHLRIS
jgi:hypothetical protein